LPTTKRRYIFRYKNDRKSQQTDKKRQLSKIRGKFGTDIANKTVDEKRRQLKIVISFEKFDDGLGQFITAEL